MGIISVSLPVDGTTADVADVNTPITTIVNEINGNLDNSNLVAGAAIAGSKLADGGLVTAKYADGSVTSEKLDATIACRAFRTAALNITAAGVKVVWDSESYDLGSNFNTTTGAFTAPVTGYYQVNACLAVSNLDSTGQVYCEIYVNGSLYCRGTRIYAVSSTDDPASVVCDTVPVTAGQTIEIYGTTSTTEAMQVGTQTSYVSIHFIGV